MFKISLGRQYSGAAHIIFTHSPGLKFVVCAIAHGWFARFLARAEKYLTVGLGLIGHGSKAATLVGPVAEGLGRGFSAGAPEIILASDNIYGNRLLSSNDRLVHCRLLRAIPEFHSQWAV